jgi:rsbT co-antagonist protein RsbR
MPAMASDERGPERELERVLRRFKQLQDNSSLALIELDMRGEIVGWNRQAEAVFGWGEAEILGRHFEVIVPAEARPHVEAIFRALATGEVRHSRNINVRKDGRRIVCQWYNAVLRDDDGSVYLIYCEVRDVTAEEELRRQQQLMLALAERSPLGIFARSPTGEYLYSNREYARTLGREPNDLIGKTDAELRPPELAEAARLHDAEVLAADGPLDCEYDDATHERSLVTSKFALRGDDGFAAVCGIVRDVTEPRRAERERAALQQQVIEAQREALAEVSTPLIPVAEGVLVMPLIGKIDPTRADRILEVLLAGVAEQRSRAVILDITGVRSVDTPVADALLRAARAVRLLGADTILTGIGPDVARTLVDLGVDLGGLVAFGSLHSGVRHVLAQHARG